MVRVEVGLVFVEAVDRDSKVLNFYLLRFVQACNSAPGGCTPGDLYFNIGRSRPPRRYCFGLTP
jgi:hypothetical protein